MLGQEEKVNGIKPVDLGSGRLGEVEEEDLVSFIGPLEEGAPILKDYVDSGRGQAILFLFSQKTPGEIDDLGVELDVIDLRPGVFEQLSESTARPSADEENSAGFRILEHSEMNGFLGRCRIGHG